MHKEVHVHAGMSCNFNHLMHACFARNITLKHCHIVAMGMTLATSVAQLSIINIADIRSAFDKTLASERFRYIVRYLLSATESSRPPNESAHV